MWRFHANKHISTLSKMSSNEIYVKFCKMLLPFILVFGDFRHSFLFHSLQSLSVCTFEMRNEKNTSNSAFQDNVWANCVPIENNPAYHIAVDVAVALRTYEVKKQISFGSKFSFAVNIYSVKLRSNASESHWHKVRMLHWIRNKMRQDL